MEITDKPYKPIPTIKRFHQSKGQIRCIVGPVGSAKTTGAAMEVCHYMPFFLFKTYGIKKTKWVIVRNCFSSDTEILTGSGWKFFNELGDKDLVAQLNDKDHLEFVKPTHYFKSDYVGEMVGFENEGVDFLVTPDHKLNVSLKAARTNTWAPYRFRKAKDCFGKQNMRVKRDALWEGVDSGHSEDFFEWLGFWFAEGYAAHYDYKSRGCGGWRCAITQKNNLGYVRDLFKRADIPFTEHSRPDGAISFSLPININTKPLIEELITFGKAIIKKLPPWVKDSPTKHLLAFLKGYEAGDGCHSANGVRALYTSSKTLVDDLQEISLKAGLASNIKTVSMAEKAYCINGVSGTTNADHFSITLTNKTLPGLTTQGYAGKYKGWYRETYHGKVYCVEVPSHRVYVRRNGKAHWSSQTYRELMDTTVKTIMDADDGWFPDGDYIAGDMDYTVKYENGVEVELLYRSCDRPQDVKKFKSLEIFGYWIDESIEVSDEIKRMLKNRIGRQPNFLTWAKCLRQHRAEFKDYTDDQIRDEMEAHPDDYLTRAGIETTNPPDVEHTTYSEFTWDTPPPGPISTHPPKVGHVGFWQPPYENEKNLRPGYYRDLTNDYRDNEDWAEMYIEGKPGIMAVGKLVYNNFRRDLHVAKDSLIWAKGPLWRGWDNSGNCPACVIVQMPRPNHVQILREFHTDKMGIIDFTRAVAMECNMMYPNAEWTDWEDPAGENKYSKREGGFTSNAILMRDECGVDVKPSEQNWIARKESVEKQLGLIDGLLFDPGVTRLINGFISGYAYKEIGTSGVYMDMPMKNKFSHVHDALQYVLLKLVKGGVKKKPRPQNAIVDFDPITFGQTVVSLSMGGVD